MFSLFSRWHRHKELEDAIIILSKEVSTIRLENASIRAQFAVGIREKRKSDRETTAKTLPQDVRDIIAQFPGGQVEAVFDSDGHAVFNKDEA